MPTQTEQAQQSDTAWANGYNLGLAKGRSQSLTWAILGFLAGQLVVMVFSIAFN